MSEQLLGSRIAALRGQVRRLLVLHGLSWIVAAVIPLVIFAGVADWGFHLDFFVRLSILAIIFGVALWLFVTRVVRPLIVRFGDLDIALKIEKRWPGLNDRLASTIQFLRLSKDDQRYGSPELREATVRQAIEETKSIDFREVIEYRPIVRAASFAVSGLLLASSFAVVAPESSQLALRRLFLPWAGDRWPQKTHLFLNPGETSLKIARGDSFTLSVGVKPGDRIPETARVTYRFSDGEENTELLRPVEGGEFRGRLDTVNQNFSFSVAAGDDASSIRDVDVKVVPPPALTDLKIRLVPPAYTGIPVQTLVGGLTSFKVLGGTRVELDAQFNKPLAEAVLALEDKATADPLAYNEKRTSFKTGFTASEALGFSFHLKDLEGFQNREAGRHEVRVFKDEPPRVMIVDPKTDRDVPADAVIPIRVDLDDDYGLHSARMTYQVSAGDSEPKPAVVIPLWSAPTEDAAQVQSSFVKHQEVSYEWNLEPLKLSSGSIITFHADARDYDTIKGPNVGKSREIRLRIISKEDAARQFDDSRRDLREEISRILAMQRQAIQPVDEASRVLDRTPRLSRPQRDNLNNAGLIQRQVGSRISHREDGLEQKIRRMLDDLKNFKIGNDEAQAQMQEMLERLSKLRDQNLETAEQELSRAGKSLDQVNEQTDEKFGQASQPNGPDQAKEQNQAKGENQGQDQAKEQDRVSDQAGSQDEAGADKSRAADAGKSAVESKDQVKTPEAKAQGGETGKPDQKNDRTGEAAGAEDKPEPAEASKATPSSKPLDAAKQSLTQAKANQQAIADELNQMLDSLSEFETFRGVVKDAQDLLKKQEEAIKQSSDAASKPDFAGKKADELSPEQKNDLENLARQQSELSKDLQSLQERMKGLAGKMEESDAQGASAMREATENSQKQGTAGKMAEAAERLQQNQLGQAKAQQEKARQELRDLIDSIQNRKERELSRLVKDLKQAENELRQLRKRQAQNLMATREAKKNPNAQERQQQLKKLAKEQAQIQEELKKQLQKLSKLNAERAGKAASNAQAKMGKAQQDLDDDQGDEADKNEEEALADLNDAQEELEEARKEAEERLGMEQLARMADQIKSLAERQAKMVADTKEREDLREKNDGRLTPAQRTSVRELGLVQAGLKEETDAMTNQLEGAPVFSLTLRRAGESMDVAAQRLQTLKTDEETQKAVKTAADRFQQLLESLKADDQKGGQGQQGGGGGGGGGGSGSGGGDGIPATAQLKMLKTLQRELNDRTEAFDELRRRAKQLTPQQLKEVDQLAADQGSLADLVRDLTRPKKDDGEE